MKERLLYPKGLRFPNDDEFPKGNDVESLKAIRNSAQLFTGYRVHMLEEDSEFKVLVECNVNPDQLWNVFADLATLLPETNISALIGERDEDLTQSSLNTRANLIATFKKYSFELVHDCFLQFGLASNQDTQILLLVTRSKYIQFWSSDDSSYQRVMNLHQLEQNQQLEYLDQFPTMTVALELPYRHFSETYQHLLKDFEL